MILKWRWILSLSLAMMLIWCSAHAQESDKSDKPNQVASIKEVMIVAHKKGLIKKVAIGKAAAGEKKRLLELYNALAKFEPPKGDKKSWKKRTGQLVAAAKAAVEGTEGYSRKLLKASDCTSCHKAHK